MREFVSPMRWWPVLTRVVDVGRGRYRSFNSLTSRTVLAIGGSRHQSNERRNCQEMAEHHHLSYRRLSEASGGREGKEARGTYHTFIFHFQVHALSIFDYRRHCLEVADIVANSKQ